MKMIAALSMVKNEQDVIESFVRHVLSFCDVLLICDHHSSDLTGGILSQLQQEGLPLVVYHEENPAYIQSEVMTNLAKAALDSYAADLLLPLDADEFLVPQHNGDIRSILEALPTDSVYRLPWRGYAPVCWQENVFLLQQEAVQARDFLPGQKIIVGAECVRKKDFHLQEGNHNVILHLPEGEQIIPQVLQDKLELAHYCWRSLEQYATKVMTSWPNLVAKYSQYTIAGNHMRPLFTSLQRNGMPSWQELLPQDAVASEASRKVQSISLQYSQDTRPNPMQNLMAASVHLAEALLEQKVMQRRKVVTIVIPYLGEKAALQNSLQEAVQQDYTYKEILILEIIPATAELKNCGWQNDSVPVKWVTFASIRQQAKGDYVQWLMPGEHMVTEKIRQMLLVMESQDKMVAGGVSRGQAISLLVCDSLENGYFPQQEVMSVGVRNSWWQEMLRRQKVPAGGLAALLVKRSLMDQVQWLQGCFLDENPLLITMWRQLLRADEDGGERLLGIMKADYIRVKQESAEEQCFRQLEWQCLLDEEKRLEENAR